MYQENKEVAQTKPYTENPYYVDRLNDFGYAEFNTKGDIKAFYNSTRNEVIVFEEEERFDPIICCTALVAKNVLRLRLNDYINSRWEKAVRCTSIENAITYGK